jgi:hypothetical protein
MLQVETVKESDFHNEPKSPPASTLAGQADFDGQIVLVFVALFRKPQNTSTQRRAKAR